ncbi:hypothetical protein QLX08_003331 [Tetragonisca angustula]|uniref:Uncharacterized protein n=1 Tax=Tetragonisca angustula TaxID=166442 RepID=A0AAW1A9U6_9HYME
MMCTDHLEKKIPK